MRTKGSKNKKTKGIVRKVVCISLQPEEVEKLKQIAKNEGKTVSQLIKDKILKWSDGKGTYNNKIIFTWHKKHIDSGVIITGISPSYDILETSAFFNDNSGFHPIAFDGSNGEKETFYMIKETAYWRGTVWGVHGSNNIDLNIKYY